MGMNDVFLKFTLKERLPHPFKQFVYLHLKNPHFRISGVKTSLLNTKK